MKNRIIIAIIMFCSFVSCNQRQNNHYVVIYNNGKDTADIAANKIEVVFNRAYFYTKKGIVKFQNVNGVYEAAGCDFKDNKICKQNEFNK